MNDFSISLGVKVFESEGDRVISGSLAIGGFSEDFYASLSYWHRDNYLYQWREGLGRLLSGKRHSAVVTTMYNPSKSNFIFWWVMYLIGDNVHIQNHVLLFEELERPFDEADLYSFIPVRETQTEEGDPISEWVVSISAIKRCIDSL